MADGVKLIMDGATMHELLASPSGPLGLFMLERGEIAKTLAKGNVQDMTEAHSGCLQASIVKRFATDGPLLSVIIQSDTSPCSPDHRSYSLMVHEGTRAHNIPNAFGWGPTFGIGGRFDGLFHPGTSPRPFLRKALEQMAGGV